ncbi:hypothetical protein LSM04_001891 [Trypanosoma melophagium]|uniref:uncharacterized protein n=1 Tax=Trypanosoma melophagium TaxID=715481 RepID=UPI00351A48A6|nr:hypothetical protein LSM04_001891 [Trypanosoma melophagium]
MSQTVHIRTDRPRFLPRRSNLNSAINTTAARFPGFVPGTSFDASAPSRRETLQEFQHLEMMVEVEEQLHTDTGLVLSDNGEDMDDIRIEYDKRVVTKPREESAIKATLREAREEIAGKSLHTDPYKIESIWLEAQRETQLEEAAASPHIGENLFSGEYVSLGSSGDLCSETHATIMEDLAKLEFRLTQARTRQQRRFRRSSSAGVYSGKESCTSEETRSCGESEFDPERYIAPLLQPKEMMSGTDLLLLNHRDEEKAKMSSSTLHEILPDAASVQEALQLLQYSIHSNRPDVLACVQRCKEEQQQQQGLHQHQQQEQELQEQVQLVSRVMDSPVREDKGCLAKIPDNTKIVTMATRESKPTEESTRSRPVVGWRLPTSSDHNNTNTTTTSNTTYNNNDNNNNNNNNSNSNNDDGLAQELRVELQEQRRIIERLAVAQEANLQRPKPISSRTPVISTRERSEPRPPQSPQRNPTRPLPPVITITNTRPLSTPSPVMPQVPYHHLYPHPPHYVQEELRLLHRQYERILRDERHAWMDLMQKQKDAFNREKNETMELIRHNTVQQQRENTEEIKRALANQEQRHRRWQHVTDMEQQKEFKKMLSKNMPVGIVGSKENITATLIAQGRHPYSQREPKRTVKQGVKKQGGSQEAMENKKEEGDSGEKIKNNKARRPPVKGPFRVVLPKEEGEEKEEGENKNEVQRSINDSTAMLEKNRMNTIQLVYSETNGGARVFTGRKKIVSSLQSPVGRRTTTRQTQRLPRDSSVKCPMTSARGSTKNISKSEKEDTQSYPCSGGLIENNDVTSYAFAVKDAHTAVPRKFQNTSESILSSSSTFSLSPPPPPPPFVLTHDGDKWHKQQAVTAAQALFLREVVLLSDQLTPEEAEKRRDIEYAYDASRYIPSPVVQQDATTTAPSRPCDVYYFGEEESNLTPRRRAKLRAAEAQTRLEARRRLERLKALSLPPRPQKLGEPPQYLQDQSDGEYTREEERIADIIAKETIHSIIGDAAEQSLFTDLLKELESELVRRELRCIATRKINSKEGNEEHQLEEVQDAPEIMLVERVDVTSGTRSNVINEELSLNETVLRCIEETIMQSILHTTGKENKTTTMTETKIQEEEKEPKVATVSGTNLDHDETVELVLEEVSRNEDNPVWVHEVVTTIKDPLWSDEKVTEPPVKLSQQRQPSQSVIRIEDSQPPSSAPNAGVVLSLTGTGSSNNSILAAEGGTLRIVLDVAPVMQHLTNTMSQLQPQVQPTALQQQQEQQQQQLLLPAPRVEIANEDKRLLCDIDEDLCFSEVLDAPIRTGIDNTLMEKPFIFSQQVQQQTVVPLASQSREVDTVHSSSLPFIQTNLINSNNAQNDLPPSIKLQGPSVLEIEVLPETRNSQGKQREKQLYWEQEKEQSRCQENETLQRKMLEDQEETLRSSWYMLWDWHQMNVSLLHNQPKEKQKEDNLEEDEDEKIRSKFNPILVESTVVGGVDTHPGESILPPAPSPVEIRDPITKFIFEWMHEYDENNVVYEKPAPKSFLERLQEANYIAEGRMPINIVGGDDDGNTSSTVEDVRRQLLLDIDQNNDSSSWLSSTHPSSVTENGFPQFVKRSHCAVVRYPHRTYRHSDENPSSMTTETTQYYSSSSSPLPVCTLSTARNTTTTTATTTTTNTTTTTTSTSSGRTWSPTNSSEKPQLRERMLRHLRSIQPTDQYQQVRQWTAEELRRQVETIQDAEEKAAASADKIATDATRMMGFANEQLISTGPPVQSIPSQQQSKW